MPGRHNLSIYTGDSATLPPITFYRSPGGEVTEQNPLIPLDLTGCQVKAQIRETVRTSFNMDTPPLAEFEVINSPLGVDGRVELYLSPEESAKLMGYRRCVWDLQIHHPETLEEPRKVITYLAGTVSTTSDVSEV